MTIHVDHQDRVAEQPIRSTLPNSVLSRTQHDAVQFLEHCALGGEALAGLTGAAGSGKTVALNTALARVESAGQRVIRVNNFVAGPLSLHRVLAACLGITDASELSADALEPALRKALLEAGPAEPPVLAVDDAQSLLPETLRYLSLLAGLRENGRPLLRILLVGRPGFAARQAMSLQSTLELMSPADVRDVVAHTMQAAGVPMSGHAIEETVERARGNWRRLAMLLQTRLEETPADWSRVVKADPARGGRPSAYRRGGTERGWRAQRAWAAVIILMIVGATAFVAMRWDRFAGLQQQAQPAAGPIKPTTAASPPLAAATTSPATPAIRPPAAHLPAGQTISPPDAAPDHQSIKPAQPTASAPAPQATVPPPAASPANPVQANPLSPDSASGDPIAAPAPEAPAPASAPMAEASPPTAGSNAPTQPLPPAQPVPPAPKRFRIYNVSACHHGVCPRWAVLDLDDNARFTAAFDYSGLNLDKQTIQRLREGAIDLTVNGSIVRNGPNGRTIRATQLDGITPHRRRAANADDAASSDAPARDAVFNDGGALTQSPLPRFLALPDRPTEASSTAAMPPGGGSTNERPANQGPIQLAPPPMR